MAYSANQFSRSGARLLRLVSFPPTGRRETVMNDEKKSGRGTKAKSTGPEFTPEEKAAMKERAKELKAEAARGKKEADLESEVLAKIAEMPKSDRTMAERIHALVKANAPELKPKLWYGMPAYAKDGKVVCYFTSADKFKARYASFGFDEAANLDEGSMWATSFALTKLTATDEKKLGELVKKAVS
ncbi:iron chaperone [Cryobacterium sp. BB736]|uniref:iron chaperone n=1 Tax=Cryobacterium sp. BB736 TaxID=2746963 RepID=UPI00351CAD12